MKTYKCKKCQTEFQDLNKYRAHILKCKGEPEEEKPEEAEKLEGTAESTNGENTEQNPEEKEDEENALSEEAVKEPKIPLERARQLNSCRGEFEGKYREICSCYDKCADCWADYGE